MGGYAWKVFRLVVWEALKEAAPSVDYNDGMIANLIQVDPWRGDPNDEVPYVQLRWLHVKEHEGPIVEAYTTMAA
jgi:hypothetical protein